MLRWTSFRRRRRSSFTDDQLAADENSALTDDNVVDYGSHGLPYPHNLITPNQMANTVAELQLNGRVVSVLRTSPTRKGSRPPYHQRTRSQDVHASFEDDADQELMLSTSPSIVTQQSNSIRIAGSAPLAAISSFESDSITLDAIYHFPPPLSALKSSSPTIVIPPAPSHMTNRKSPSREFRFSDNNDNLSQLVLRSGSANDNSGGSGAAATAASRTAVYRRRSSVVREKWASKLEFLLAVIGFAVDLGNVWRFPYICYKNGGGAFLIPYLVMLFLGGLPMFYMELALGQFHRCSQVVWVPLFTSLEGTGYAICFIATYVACYYNSIISYAVYFFFSSLQADVPWKTCNNTWNTARCTDRLLNVTPLNELGEKYTSPAEEFFLYNVLERHKSTGFDGLGGVKGSLAACLFIVFLIVYFALWKGPRSSGKAVWITATMPYVVLTILLIRGITLPGAAKGIEYYLTPKFDRLLETGVWIDAATQIFFSLGPGFGVLLALASYNEFNNNCYRDAIVTSSINCLTSFLSGFVIFSTLGYMGHMTNRNVSEVAGEGGSGLIFIVYPQAISTMQYSSFWSLIFFFMLITLGIDSTFGGLEALITGFCDEYPRVLHRKRELFVFLIVIFYYCGSLFTVTYGGTYVIEFLDVYGVSFSVLFIVVAETVAVCWCYGVKRFSEDIRQMLGFYPGIYWRFCWALCPIFISSIFLVACYNTSFAQLQLESYVYPYWSVPFGWFVRLTSMMCVPLYAIYYLWSMPGTLRQRLRAAITPQQRHSSMISSGPSIVDPPPSHPDGSTNTNGMASL